MRKEEGHFCDICGEELTTEEIEAGEEMCEDCNLPERGIL